MVIDHRWTWRQYLRRLQLADLKLRYLLRDPLDVEANQALADEIDWRNFGITGSDRQARPGNRAT